MRTINSDFFVSCFFQHYYPLSLRVPNIGCDIRIRTSEKFFWKKESDVITSRKVNIRMQEEKRIRIQKNRAKKKRIESKRIGSKKKESWSKRIEPKKKESNRRESDQKKKKPDPKESSPKKKNPTDSEGLSVLSCCSETK